MRKAFLIRDRQADESCGKFGSFTTDSGFSVYSLERPSSGDHPCIPAGTYEVKKTPHPIHGLCYEVQNVPGRSAILIHPANWFFQLLGCIALGRSVQIVEGPSGGKQIKSMGITSSKDAVNGFEKDIGGADFELVVSQK